jgi:hypothetical protein
MFGRGLANLVGFVGGVLMALGGALALLIDAARGAGPQLAGVAGGVVASLLAVVLGVVAIGLSRPHLFGWGGRRTITGVLMIGVGAIAWVLVSVDLLVLVGAALTMLAGLVFLVEGLFVGASTVRRRFGRRY